MALSYEFKQTMKFRTKRSRRMAVLGLFVMMALGLGFAARPFPWSMFPIIYGYPVLWLSPKGSYVSWDWRRRVIPVATLDDRAMLEHGMAFDDLGKADQEELLSSYQGGTVLLNDFPDEREHELQAAVHLRAYKVLRVLLPVVLLCCWAAWRWVPGINVLVLLFWVVILVLGLPQMILLWTEPEDVREMQAMKRPSASLGREA